jgi:SAM-dependent methyltransferase
MTTIPFRNAADMFTSAIATYALSAAWEVGLLDEIDEKGEVNIDQFVASRDLHKASICTAIDMLASRDVLTKSGTDAVAAGENFREFYETKGFFYWLTRGCGELFASLPRVMNNTEREGAFYQRDLRAVGVACRDMGVYYFDEPLRQLLKDLTFETVADLGCGSGERLIQMTSADPSTHGVGVDISSNALKLAGESIQEAGLEDRIALVHADARNLSPVRAFNDVDLVTCFLMGHDLWPRDACIESLQRLKNAFPNVRNLVLCDTYRSNSFPTPEPTLFTPGFEMAHAAMGVELPTLDDWMGVFEDGGWKCTERRDITTPAFTSMFVLNPI